LTVTSHVSKGEGHEGPSLMHDAHRLPQEVTLLENQSFPRCSKCSEPVYFKLVRSAPAAGRNPGFAVLLYELPELAEQEDQSLAG
jgi:hypothetical protein